MKYGIPRGVGVVGVRCCDVTARSQTRNAQAQRSEQRSLTFAEVCLRPDEHLRCAIATPANCLVLVRCDGQLRGDVVRLGWLAKGTQHAGSGLRVP
jgi:hypothetical protein